METAKAAGDGNTLTTHIHSSNAHNKFREVAFKWFNHFSVIYKVFSLLFLPLDFFFICFSTQITVFRMGSEGQQDIEMAILTALLKGSVLTVRLLSHEGTASSAI